MDNVQRDIELTARLLRADRREAPTDPMRAFDDLFAQFESYIEAVMSSSVPEGERIANRLSTALERTEIFLSYPQLLGKTLIGLIAFDEEIFKRCLAPFISDLTINRLLLDTNLPCLLLDQPDELKVLNDADNETELNGRDYARANRQLYRYGLDIRQWLKAFSIHAEAQSHSAFVFLPLHMDMRAPFNRNLIDKLDAAFVFAPSELPSKHADFLKRFQTLLDQKPLYHVPSKIAEGDVPILLRQLDCARLNHIFVEQLQLALLDVEKFYADRLRDAESDMRQLNSDLLKLNESDTRELLSTLQNQTRHERSTLEHEQATLSKAAARLLEKATAFETLMGSSAALNDRQSFRTATLENIGALILRAVELGNFGLASSYVHRLNRIGHGRSYVFELLIEDGQGRSLNRNALERLKVETDDETIRRAKLRLHGRLGFSDFDCMQLARDIKHLSTADEFYYRGRWVERANVKEAIGFYKRAAREGSQEACARLLELSSDRPEEHLLEWLANRLVPAANYRLGLKARDEGRFGKSMTQFKLAAAHEYLPAIKELAKFFRRKVLGKKNAEAGSNDGKLKNCLQLHHYILQRDPTDTEAREALGDLYRQSGDERRAFEHWDRCSTSTANYKCGRLFQYPDGSFPQDLDRAEKYFEAASRSGHAKAGSELEKVRAWKRNAEARRARQEYDARRDYSTRTETYDDDHDDGFCLITTAVCKTLDLGDECDELMTMRAYRDEIKGRDPHAALLIEEYYRVAPLLIERIDRRSDRAKEYARLWREYIRETYRLIKAGRSREATLKYIDMVIGLCRQYKVPLSAGIEKAIAEFHA